MFNKSKLSLALILLLVSVATIVAGCNGELPSIPEPLPGTELKESEVGQFPPTEEDEARKAESGQEAEGKAAEGGHEPEAEAGGDPAEAGGHAEEPRKSREELKVESLLAKARRVPDKQAAIVNPLKRTEKNIEVGRLTYMSHCASCHGIAGYGDGATGAGLNPLPSDLHEDFVQLLPDGALAYLIANGIGQGMPGFAKKLEEEQLWQLVVYLRTFGEYRSPALVE